MQSPQFQAHARLEKDHWWFAGRRTILQAVVHALVPPSQSVHLVDVGCGTGGNTSLFAHEYDSVGIDPSAEAIQFARERFPDVRFMQGDALTKAEEIHTADIVLLMDVLEHIEDDFLFVSKLLSLTKPGAYLVLAAPNDPELWGPHDKAFEHYRRYTPERLRMLWKGLPVSELLLTCINSRLYPLAKFVRYMTRLRGKSIGENETDIAMPSTASNKILRRVFAGENVRIVRALQRKAIPYKKGVSVLAVLRREAGMITARAMPSDVKDATPWRD